MQENESMHFSLGESQFYFTGGARGGRRREPVANAAPFTGAAANPRRNPPRGGGRAGRGKQPLAR